MKELHQICNFYKRLRNDKLNGALATVVNIEGSSYRRIGARMIIDINGNWIGGISGGCLEGDILHKAKAVILDGIPRMVTYDTREGDEYEIGIGLGCRGKIDIFIESLQELAIATLFDRFEAILESRNPQVIAHVLHNRSEMTVMKVGDRYYSVEEGGLSDFVKEDFKLALSLAKSKYCAYEDGKIAILYEIFIPRIHLVIVGSHYDIPPLINIARELFWKITLICRPEKMGKELLELCDNILDSRNTTLIRGVLVDYRSAILLMTHDYKRDKIFLRESRNMNFPFTGILGPHKRIESIIQDFEEEGEAFSVEELDKIYSPMGLDIGAASPETIALSIIAELQTFFYGGGGGHLREGNGSIHVIY